MPYELLSQPRPSLPPSPLSRQLVATVLNPFLGPYTPLLRAKVSDGFVLFLSRLNRTHLDVQLPLEVTLKPSPSPKSSFTPIPVPHPFLNLVRFTLMLTSTILALSLKPNLITLFHTHRIPTLKNPNSKSYHHSLPIGIIVRLRSGPPVV